MSIPELIHNQKDVGEKRYGFRSSAATGCGWVATVNALALLGYHTDTDALIRYYERLVPLIHGNCGTMFWAPALCMQRWGFPVEVVLDRKKFDGKAGQADVCILFYRWRKRWQLGAHFVALHRKDGNFVGYNTYRNSTGPDVYGPSLEDFLQRRGYFGSVLICIQNKK